MKKKLSFLLKKEYLLLYLFLIFGSFLRLQGVFTNSFAFTYDVGRDMLALANIVYDHRIPLIGATTGLPGVFYGPWWYYMLTPFFIIFMGNPQGIAFIMALIGIVSIFLGFILGKKIGKTFLGILLSLLISVSSTMISLSAQIWNPNIAPLFVIFILLVLNKIYSKENKSKLRYYFLLGVLLALNIDLEIVFGLLLFFGIIFSVILIVNKHITLKQIGVFIIGVLVIFSPRILFELRHQFLMTKAFLNFLTNGDSSNNLPSIANILSNRLGIFFDQFNQTLTMENEILGFTFLIFIIISFLFLYKKAELVIKNFSKTSIIVVFIFVVGTTFFSHDIWPHYLVGLPVFYILLLGIATYLVWMKFPSKWFALLLALVLFFVNINPFNVVKNVTAPLWEGDSSVYRNQLAVIDYVYNQANGKRFKYVVYTPPVHDYTYQYLFRWYGQKKYKYQSSVQENLAFFIIEPDLQYQSRLNDWLKQRQEDGEIIKSEKIKGGIIVQTRIH